MTNIQVSVNGATVSETSRSPIDGELAMVEQGAEQVV